MLGVGVFGCVGAGSLDQPVQGVAQVAALVGEQRADRPAQQLHGTAGVGGDVVAQVPAQLHLDALAGGDAAQEQVHLRDQLLGLQPPCAQRLAEIAQDVLLEQPPLAVGEQLRVARDGGGQSNGQLADRVLPRVVPADDGERSPISATRGSTSPAGPLAASRHAV